MYRYDRRVQASDAQIEHIVHTLAGEVQGISSALAQYKRTHAEGDLDDMASSATSLENSAKALLKMLSLYTGRV